MKISTARAVYRMGGATFCVEAAVSDPRGAGKIAELVLLQWRKRRSTNLLLTSNAYGLQRKDQVTGLFSSQFHGKIGASRNCIRFAAKSK